MRGALFPSGAGQVGIWFDTRGGHCHDPWESTHPEFESPFTLSEAKRSQRGSTLQLYYRSPEKSVSVKSKLSPWWPKWSQSSFPGDCRRAVTRRTWCQPDSGMARKPETGKTIVCFIFPPKTLNKPLVLCQESPYLQSYDVTIFYYKLQIQFPNSIILETANQ